MTSVDKGFLRVSSHAPLEALLFEHRLCLFVRCSMVSGGDLHTCVVPSAAPPHMYSGLYCLTLQYVEITSTNHRVLDKSQ